MGSSALAADRLARMDDLMAGHVERGGVPGAVWAVARRGEAHVGVAGELQATTHDPIRRDSIFRISSMTKPVTAVAALILVEEGVLRMDDPVDARLPELADRRVLRTPASGLDDTVPADRSITLRDLLTFRLGWGMDFAATGPQPIIGAMAELGLGVGPPAPASRPAPDEWLRRLGTLPLQYQPGSHWLYHTGAEVLGVLIARASGQTLDTFMQERVFAPLGMRDTGFAVPTGELRRLGGCYVTDPETGTRALYDARDGQWSHLPAFPSGGDGLVSTVDDYLSFVEMLRSGGAHDGKRLLARPSIEAMTTNHLTPEQLAVSGPDPGGVGGWGFGVGVQIRADGPGRGVGTYGWDGGLGTSWANDPSEDLVGVLLTNQTWNSPSPPPVCQDFWTAAYAAVDD